MTVLFIKIFIRQPVKQHRFLDIRVTARAKYKCGPVCIDGVVETLGQESSDEKT